MIGFGVKVCIFGVINLKNSYIAIIIPLKFYPIL